MERWRRELADWYRTRQPGPVGAEEVHPALLSVYRHFRSIGRIPPPDFPPAVRVDRATPGQRAAAERYARTCAAVIRPWLSGEGGHHA